MGYLASDPYPGICWLVGSSYYRLSPSEHAIRKPWNERLSVGTIYGKTAGGHSLLLVVLDSACPPRHRADDDETKWQESAFLVSRTLPPGVVSVAYHLRHARFRIRSARCRSLHHSKGETCNWICR